MVGDKNVGNLETNSLKEIWNSPKMMQYRKDMLEGKKINACMKCWSKEEAGTVSYRMDYNSYYKDRLDKITANTDKNGFEHNFNIISVKINNDERNLSTLRWGDFAGHETVMHGTEEKKVSIQIDHNFYVFGYQSSNVKSKCVL